MSDIFKVIFQLDADGSKVLEEVNKVKNAYVKTNAELKKQEAELDKLLRTEAELLRLRTQVNSPSQAAKLTKELTKVQAQIVKTKDEVNKLTIAERNSANEAVRLKTELQKAFGQSTINGAKNLTQQASSAGSKLSQIVAGFGAAQLIKEVIATTSAFERYNAVLTNTLGSSDLAGQTISEIKDFAAKTPFSVDELTSSFVKLANQGFIPTRDEMRKLGDLASSTGKSFDQLSEAIIDAQTGEFERLKEFGIRASKEGDKVKFTFKGVQTQTDFTAESIRKYVLSLGDAEGVTGSMAAISETLGGQISNLGDKWDDFLNTLGTKTGPVIKGVISFLGLLLDGVKSAVSDISDIVTGEIVNTIDIESLVKAGARTEDAAKRLKKAGIDISDPYDKAAQKIVHDFNLIDDQFQSLAEGISANSTKAQNETVFEVFGLHSRKLTEDLKKGTITQDEYNKRLSIMGDAFKIAKDRQALYGKEVQKTTGLTAEQKKAAEELARSLENLKKILSDAEKADTQFNISNRTPAGVEQVQAQAALTRQIIEEERKTLIKGSKGTKKELELIEAIHTQKLVNAKQEEQKAIVEIVNAQGEAEIEARKIFDEQLLIAYQAQSNTLTLTEAEAAEKRLDIQQKYFDDSIELAQENIAAREHLGLDTTKEVKALEQLQAQKLAVIKTGEREIADLKFKQEDQALTDQETHEENRLRLVNAANSRILRADLQFEKARLELLKQNGKELTQEYKDQADKVAALAKEAKKQQILEYTDYTETIVDAAVQATNKILDAKIKEVEKQTELQSKRVDEAKDIASDGNAELLQLEQDRLDNLNKQKEKFVRQQQALATIELVANTAIAVSKAAAEGGAGAAFTIAAALLALIGGLASARAIASQAAFYEGGYTGDGDPKQQSDTIGGRKTQRHYDWHKGEFVVSHKPTRGLRGTGILEGVNKGMIDLREWKEKVAAYDSFNTGRQIHASMPQITNRIEVNEMKQQMSELIEIVKGQHTSINLNGKGFSVHMKKIVSNMDYLNRLAR